MHDELLQKIAAALNERTNMLLPKSNFSSSGYVCNEHILLDFLFKFHSLLHVHGFYRQGDFLKHFDFWQLVEGNGDSARRATSNPTNLIFDV